MNINLFKAIVLMVLMALVAAISSCQYGRYTQKQRDKLVQSKLINEALQEKAAQLVAMQDKLATAQAKNTQLRQQHEKDANYSRAAVNRLQQQIRDTGRLRSDTQGSEADYGNAVGILLSNCAAEYQHMARIADGHAADVILLQDSWPFIHHD